MREEIVKRVLKECFCLEDNPFDPGEDPQCKFNFRENKASLAKPLDIFNINGLEPFFIKIGKFKEAVEEVEEFLMESGWMPGVDPPPTFLVEAESGVGRSSLANYIAYLVKDRLIAGPAALHTETIQGEDYAQLIFSLKKVIEVHAREFKVAGCEVVFETYPDSLLDSKNPNLYLLNNLFQKLSTLMADTPPLLVIVESITYKRGEWMNRLYEMLSPLNVVFIFLTEDRRVRLRYDELIASSVMSGRAVELEALDRSLAEDFFDMRFKPYRLGECSQGKPILFPFEPDIFSMAFKAEKDEEGSPTFGVKFLITVFRGALNIKINKLSPSFNQENPQIQTEQLVITWKDVEAAFRRVVRRTARGRQ